MASCNSTSLSSLKYSRNFLQYPSPDCGMETCYYGRDCQMMEIEMGDYQIRSQSSPIRTWNRRSGTWCEIGNTESPPGISTATIRFYEPCAPGIPLPYHLGKCDWRTIINHGLCQSTGDLLNGWSDYVEVVSLRSTSINGGRRAAYDGADDARTLTITADILARMMIGPMQFSEVSLADQCTPADLSGDSAAFGCNVGCGDSACGCQEACDDGTRTMYFGLSCAGGESALVSYTTDGGETVKTLVLPTPAASGGVATTYPKVAVCGSTLYCLAYENPVSLFAIELDSNGAPSGSWTEIAVLGSGIPGDLVCDNDVLHILVSDAAGSSYYTLDFNRDPAEGPREYFDAVNMTEMAACNNTIIVGGASGALEISNDGGATWSGHPVPETLVDDIASIKISGIYTWVTTVTGEVYRTSDDGYTWRQVNIPGISSGVPVMSQFNGEEIGWMWGAGTPKSTWFGGLNGTDWTSRKPRILAFPTDLTVSGLWIPTCADEILSANTALVMGQNANGETMGYIGRSAISGC